MGDGIRSGSGRLSRRQALILPAATGLGVALSSGFGRAAAASASVGTRSAVPISLGHLWQWEEMMVDLGPRFTGSPAHRRYLDFIEEQCHRLGMPTRHDPTQYFPRWDVDYRDCDLSVASGNGAPETLPVMSYFPGLGTTAHLPGQALSAELADAGLGLPDDFSGQDFTGKIAFVVEPPPGVPEALFYPNYYLDDPHGTMSPGEPYPKWSLSIISPQSTVTPELAAKAGCVGMVYALQATGTCARGQYTPFRYTVNGDQAGGAPGLPTLYVDYETGQRIKQRLTAGASATARVVLPARVHPNTGTDDVIAYLPGANGDVNDWSKDENVIVASHTDGTSAAEENGPLGILAIARHYAGIPRERRRRSMVFVFATGHFTGYTQDTAWFTANQPGLVEQCAASLTIEHLGQKSFTDDPAAGTYRYDGYPEVGITYVSQQSQIIATAKAAIKKQGLQRAPVIAGPGFGVSKAFFAANLPSVGYITGPNTLYQMDPKVALKGTDPDRMGEEVRTFIRILDSWDSLSRQQLQSP